MTNRGDQTQIVFKWIYCIHSVCLWFIYIYIYTTSSIQHTP